MGRKLENNRDFLDRVAKLERQKILPKTSWYELGSFNNSWGVDTNGSYGPVRYRKAANGEVTFSGALMGSSFTLPAFTLPEGFRPGFRQSIPVLNDVGPGKVWVNIDPDGSVTPMEAIASNTLSLIDAFHYGTEFNATYGGWPSSATSNTTFANSSYWLPLIADFPDKVGFTRQHRTYVAGVLGGVAGTTGCNLTINIGDPVEYTLVSALAVGSPYNSAHSFYIDTDWVNATSADFDAILTTKQFLAGFATWSGTAATAVVRHVRTLCRYLPNSSCQVPLTGVRFLAEG